MVKGKVNPRPHDNAQNPGKGVAARQRAESASKHSQGLPGSDSITHRCSPPALCAAAGAPDNRTRAS
jgi:hypothetical protein